MHADNLKTLNLHLEAENNHDIEGTLATIHPECVFQDVALNRTYYGKKGVENYYRMWWGALDIFVKSASRHWTTDNNVIVEPVFSGKHIGEFCGISPTGLNINLNVAVFVSFKDGLMIGEKFYYDTYTLFQQLGCTNLNDSKRMHGV